MYMKHIMSVGLYIRAAQQDSCSLSICELSEYVNNVMLTRGSWKAMMRPAEARPNVLILAQKWLSCFGNEYFSLKLDINAKKCISEMPSASGAFAP